METDKITKGLLDISLAHLDIFSMFACSDGSLPSGLDLVHLLIFPYKSTSHKTEWGLCRSSQKIELPLPVKEILEAEETNTRFSITELYDSLTCLAVASVLFVILSYVLHFVLNSLFKDFRNINPAHKKWYVIVNVLKACILAFICLNSKFVRGIYKVSVEEYVPMVELKRTTVLYVVSDLVGLFIVPKLPFTTKMHHIFTFLIGVLIWSSNMNIPGFNGVTGVAKMSFIYGCFSCIPFLVNAFLGFRVFASKNRLMLVFSFLAFLTYILCCALNWSFHLVWFVSRVLALDLSVWTFFYMIMLAYIVRDDLILMNFLRKYSLSDYLSKKKQS